MKYKGALFDMDGVLFDTEKMFQDTWAELARARSIDLGDSFTRDISGTNGDVMKRMIERYYHVPNGLTIIDECRAEMERKLEICVPIKSGVVDILQYLHGCGIPIAVASSSSEKQIISNLSKTGLDKYFDAVVSGYNVPHCKPAPDIFIKAANTIGRLPNECLVFEDSENGVKAGCAAECTTIMIPDMVTPSEEIKKLNIRIYPDLLCAMNALKDGWIEF